MDILQINEMYGYSKKKGISSDFWKCVLLGLGTMVLEGFYLMAQSFFSMKFFFSLFLSTEQTEYPVLSEPYRLYGVRFIAVGPLAAYTI